MEKIKTHRDLKVFRLSFEVGLEIFAFRKRKYPKSFVSKLSPSEGEAVETQVWPNYALNCKFIDDTRHIAIN